MGRRRIGRLSQTSALYLLRYPSTLVPYSFKSDVRGISYLSGTHIRRLYVVKVCEYRVYRTVRGPLYGVLDLFGAAGKTYGSRSCNTVQGGRGPSIVPFLFVRSWDVFTPIFKRCVPKEPDTYMRFV